LGNEGGAPAGGGLDRAPQRLAITHQLVEIGCATWDLCERPVADGGAESRHIHLLEEIAEG
jgi:hypothetical protein